VKLSQVTPLVSDQCVVDSTANETLLVTSWLPCVGGVTLAVTGELQAVEGAGTVTAALRYRTALVSTKRPGSWSSPGTGQSAAGQWSSTWTLADTNAQLWVQYGMVGKYATAPMEVLASLQGSVAGSSAVVVTERIQVEPTANSGTYVVKGLGKRFPILGATYAVFGIVFSGVSGTITWRPVARQFQGNEDNPGDWVDLAANQTQSAAGDVNLGRLALSPTAGWLFGQLGIKFQGDARGTMDVVGVVTY
jgi:hypothetical protein